jgi:hypothetical protein
MTTNMKRVLFRHCGAICALVLAAAATAPGPAGAQTGASTPATTSAETRGPAPTAKPAALAARKEAIRTLEAIHIEGEIPVPQVLFITARDSRRFRDGFGHTYQVGALELARSVSLPDRLRVTAQPEKP